MLRPFLLRAPLPDNASHYFLLSLRADPQTGVAIPPFRTAPKPCVGAGFYSARSAAPLGIPPL